MEEKEMERGNRKNGRGQENIDKTVLSNEKNCKGKVILNQVIEECELKSSLVEPNTQT
ncbi:MAG: hypothetical protein H5T33_05700 [Candidatus Methanosuratus sp.]|nr:hypothetical protein [Candidatus Methanosuratincola sp.]